MPPSGRAGPRSEPRLLRRAHFPRVVPRCNVRRRCRGTNDTDRCSRCSALVGGEFLARSEALEAQQQIAGWAWAVQQLTWPLLGAIQRALQTITVDRRSEASRQAVKQVGCVHAVALLHAWPLTLQRCCMSDHVPRVCGWPLRFCFCLSRRSSNVRRTTPPGSTGAIGPSAHRGRSRSRRSVA